jgi:voltage-gated potassium channel
MAEFRIGYIAVSRILAINLLKPIGSSVMHYLLVEFRHAFLWLRGLSGEVLRRRALRFLLLLAGSAVISSDFLFYLIEPNIHSPWTGIWYAWMTMTHVGYGDIVSTSFLGRVLSSLPILLGVGFFEVS